MKQLNGIKNDFKMAKILLASHGCHDCEKGIKFTISFENQTRDEYTCIIPEGTPEESICIYWSSKIE